MTEPQTLADKIAASDRLSDLRDKLAGEIKFRADDAIALDPITIIMIISIIVQVVIHCREKRNDDAIIRDIQDLRSIPPRRLIRLRRRLNALWRECCADRQSRVGDKNPFLTAVYELAESADPAALQELLDLARE